MCQVEEEGSVLVADNELHRLLGIATGEGGLIGGALNLLLVAYSGAAHHSPCWSRRPAAPLGAAGVGFMSLECGRPK